MQRIILPESLVEEFGQTQVEVHVCDPAGRVVGRFVPRAVDYARANALFPDDPEERRRIEAEKKDSSAWMTTAEAVAYIENYRIPGQQPD